jgi:hypothetical protein
MHQKVFKASGKEKPRPQRQLRISENGSSGGLQVSPGEDNSEVPPLPTCVAPCRSKRVQISESSIPKGPFGIASMDSLKVLARLRPRRNIAGNTKSRVSVKSKGISKRQRSNTTRGKAGKG